MTPQEVVDAITTAADIYVVPETNYISVKVPKVLMVLIRDIGPGVAYLHDEDEEVVGYVAITELECARIIREVTRRANAQRE